MNYQFVNGPAEDVPRAISEEDSIAQCLHWIRFKEEQERKAIMKEAFSSWLRIRYLEPSDIITMAKSLAVMENMKERVMIGPRRVSKMIALSIWISQQIIFERKPTVQDMCGYTFVDLIDSIESTMDVEEIDLPVSSDDVPFPGIIEYEYEDSDDESVISVEYRTDEESIAARTVTEEDYEIESNSGSGRELPDWIRVERDEMVHYVPFRDSTGKTTHSFAIDDETP